MSRSTAYRICRRLKHTKAHRAVKGMDRYDEKMFLKVSNERSKK